MSEELQNAEKTPETPPTPAPSTHVAPSPHLVHSSFTSRRMMIDVLLCMVPLLAASLYVFRWHAVIQIGICLISCVSAEALFGLMRRKPLTLGDFSAVVTALVLAFSLPGTAPWFVGVIGSFVAIGLGKVIFGGLGMNLFNPAMVGRAFIMIAFPLAMGATGYILAPDTNVAVTEASPRDTAPITQATPMSLMGHLSENPSKMTEDDIEHFNWASDYKRLFLGTTNGSLGETSALACLIGGLILCLRRSASWQIPLGAILAVAAVAGLMDLVGSSPMNVLHHLLGGALLFGAFFIITDPVTSPLTPKGKFIFGFGFGLVVMMLRTLSAYPEGVMFAVLLMNAVVPLINRWTVPKPLGGPVPTPAEK